MKRLLISSILALALMVVPISGALAATTQDVTVTATPSYITVSNSPGSWPIGNVEEDTDNQTTNGYFTITNGSTVTIDISFYVADGGWTSWTYGAPAENTAQLKVSSANGGSGGSTGAGAFDKTLAVGSGSSVLVMKDVGTTTNPTWEMQLDAPTTFTHGDAQTCTVTLSAAAAA